MSWSSSARDVRPDTVLYSFLGALGCASWIWVRERFRVGPERDGRGINLNVP